MAIHLWELPQDAMIVIYRIKYIDGTFHIKSSSAYNFRYGWDSDRFCRTVVSTKKLLTISSDNNSKILNRFTDKYINKFGIVKVRGLSRSTIRRHLLLNYMKEFPPYNLLDITTKQE